MKAHNTRSEEHTSELQSLTNLVCRLLLEKKNSRHQSRSSTQCRHVVATMSNPSELLRRKGAAEERAHQGDYKSVIGLTWNVFFLNIAGPPEIYPFPLHHAFPI